MEGDADQVRGLSKNAEVLPTPMSSLNLHVFLKVLKAMKILLTTPLKQQPKHRQGVLEKSLESLSVEKFEKSESSEGNTTEAPDTHVNQAGTRKQRSTESSENSSSEDDTTEAPNTNVDVNQAGAKKSRS